MNKLTMSLLITFLLLVSNINVFADEVSKFDKTNEKLKIETIDKSDDKEKVKDLLKNDMGNMPSESEHFSWNKTPTDYGKLYKIYWVKESLKNYYKCSTFDDMVSNSTVMWETPLLSKDGDIISTSRAIKNKKTGEWSISKGHTTSLDFIKFYIDPSNIEKILNENNISNPDFVKHIRIRELYTDFFYVKSDNNEYAIPYAYEPELIGVTNYKVYPIKDLIDKLTATYGKTPGKDGKMGGFVRSKFPYINPFLLLFTFIAFLLIICSFAFYRRRKFSFKKI